MNQQHDKEDDGGLGSNAQGGETKPKSKRIKLDDPNIQPIKRNQVDDEEALSDSSIHEQPYERKSEEPFVPFLEDVDEPMMSACDYVLSQLRPKWQQELAKGVDEEEALSDSSTHERPFVPFLEDVDEPKMSAGEYVRLQLLQELAKKGVDIKRFNQANWKGQCDVCGEVDKHPTDDCPFAEIIEF